VECRKLGQGIGELCLCRQEPRRCFRRGLNPTSDLDGG
jgi:hypothetical protein